jgi:hypothetical protein
LVATNIADLIGWLLSVQVKPLLGNLWVSSLPRPAEAPTLWWPGLKPSFMWFNNDSKKDTLIGFTASFLWTQIVMLGAVAVIQLIGGLGAFPLEPS